MIVTLPLRVYLVSVLLAGAPLTLVAGCASPDTIAQFEAGPPNDLITAPVDLQGEPIRWGRLKTKYLVFDSGHEAMLLTRVSDGYRMYIESRETGGPVPPSISEYSLDEEMHVRSMSFRPLRKGSEGVEFVVDNGELVRRDSTGVTRIAMDEGGVFLGPHDSAIFIAIRPHLGLAVGESTTAELLLYGNTGDNVVRTEARLSRLKNAELHPRGVAPLPVRVYDLVYPADHPTIRSRYWVDDDGFVLKGRTRLPVGRLSMEWVGGAR